MQAQRATERISNDALGPCEARCRGLRRVWRVTSAATLSNLMRKRSTWAVASAVLCKASARWQSF